jgi:F-type H+-transporting ATPase subunit epsilon
MMRLKVFLPSEILIDEEVIKIVAEAQNGFFCLLPRHIDYLSTLVPGIFYYFSPDGSEKFLAVDQGILVKCGLEVLVSIRNAVQGPELGVLEKMIKEQFEVEEEREIATNLAFSKLEANFVRRFMEVEIRE